MVRLSFYGGINEIGGNKILLEDGENGLLLDFGFPYKRHKLFYEEYLKPRSGAGLLDPLAMGLLPPLEGIYREDMEQPGLWQLFADSPLHRKLDHIDGVLLSHAHLDHSGHISFLRGDIPVYATSVTAFIAKAIQDSGKSDFDQQVCYFSPQERGLPAGWKQTASLTSSGPKQQRQFCIADRDPQELGQSAQEFWSQGFWERTARQKELISLPVTDHGNCCFHVRCFPVDHSIPGACAWGIETSAGWVIYSGDLRLHGKRPELTTAFIEGAASLSPRALILEGTNVMRDSNVAEQEVYKNALKAIRDSDGLVIADSSARDVDRLLTLLKIAKETGRSLAITPRDAYLLKTMHLLEPAVPDVGQERSLVIYQDTVANRYPNLWVRNICQECDEKIVVAEDVRSNQGDFILCFSFFDMNELPSIRPREGSLYVYSSSEPHDEEQEIDFRRLHQWLDLFGLRGFGLPTEGSDGWRIPPGEEGLHASGHACGTDLLEIARGIKPEILIPVHSEHPEFYLDNLANSSITVILPALNGSVNI
ncbi:MAG: exonuclease [Chloroflexi bacterium]|nr:exonuclease [Chloroflexota bacterium]